MKNYTPTISRIHPIRSEYSAIYSIRLYYNIISPTSHKAFLSNSLYISLSIYLSLYISPSLSLSLYLCLSISIYLNNNNNNNQSIMLLLYYIILYS